MPIAPVTHELYEANDWYEPNEAAMKKINAAGALEIILFHGGWCKDCQYYMPVFNRITAAITNPGVKLTVADVPRDTRRDAAGLTDKYTIKNIPTFVVLRDGKEAGRIIEHCKDTIETDIAAML